MNNTHKTESIPGPSRKIPLTPVAALKSSIPGFFSFFSLEFSLLVFG